MLSFENFEQVGPAQGSNQGGRFEHDDGSDWYLKYPNSERQGHNEIIASRLYDAMGFDAIQYHPVDNGMVASPWRPDLPNKSQMAALRGSDVVQEAFLPSALIANWDVIGLVYDNCLYNPDTMSEPVFLDFGGTFDTRAMGGDKPYRSDDIPSLEGFRDPGINRSAYRVFEELSPSQWDASQRRVRSLSASDIRDALDTVELSGADTRRERVQMRQSVLLATDYDEVF